MSVASAAQRTERDQHRARLVAALSGEAIPAPEGRLALLAARFGLGLGPIRAALERLREQGRVLEGEFLPGGREREWCDVEVLRRLKRVSLAKLTALIDAAAPALHP